MTVILVFSKDRAMQLDACLASLRRHVRGADAASVHVVYASSSTRFARQYDVLAREYGGWAQFRPEGNFEATVLEALRSHGEDESVERAARGSGPQGAAEACVLFLVDDTIFIAGAELAALCLALHKNADCLGVSLRLGRNTTRSYVLGRNLRQPRFRSLGGALVKFKWVGADGDFAYPMEISSSLYRVSTVLGVLTRLSFADPNSMESQMSVQAPRFRRSQPHLLCLSNSIAFSAPINRVQAVYDNRSGDDQAHSPAALAQRFEDGERIDVAALDGFVPSSCHQEIDLEFLARGLPGGSG